MRISLRLIATYRDLLPPEARHSTVEVELPPGSTAADALTRFNVPLGPETVILLNGLTVASDAPLSEGDEIAAFSAVAGG